jgi:hypothetical protein
MASTEMASGRRVVRRWGHIPPDTVTVQFRVKEEDEPSFNYFWHRTGLDGTWFTADWLAVMGYDDHKARLLGYPRRKGVTGQVMDYAVTIVVQETALCVDPAPWLSGRTGDPTSSE